MLEIIKRDGKPRHSLALKHNAKQDHALFEGLDNSNLLSNSALAKATFKDIFGITQNTITQNGLNTLRER